MRRFYHFAARLSVGIGLMLNARPRGNRFSR